ncbi:MAG TPA: glycosyltransferase family 9 protein [Stellaceae bacterium]|nr:glycosyltransferase family 9 protein [Stellaceae bacterium]
MKLTAQDFPPGTPLHHFFAWNEAAWRPDRRYKLARDTDRLPSTPEGRRVVASLDATRGNPDIAAHAAVFAAFEALRTPARPRPQRVLVIRLSALGDFVQALGPIAAIRRHHAGDRLTLLTTRSLAGFAEELGLFDEVLVDERPGPLAIGGWLALRRMLRRGRFDRVYDLQTSMRTSLYSWLLRPGMPEWSGIAPGCSHPHANLARDRQHTIDEQAEQLLMAGIYPTPLPTLPPLDRALPEQLAGRDFALLVPGSSPQHPAKRWPATAFGAVARALAEAGCVPVVVGAAAERLLAAEICEACPDAVDLTGRTDLVQLAALCRHARLTIGNDTGVCHLAAAAGSPLIVLFSRESDPARCAPRGRLVRVLAAPNLANLAAEAVIADAIDILAANSPSASRSCGPGPSLSPRAGRGPG